MFEKMRRFTNKYRYPVSVFGVALLVAITVLTTDLAAVASTDQSGLLRNAEHGVIDGKTSSYFPETFRADGAFIALSVVMSLLVGLSLAPAVRITFQQRATLRVPKLDLRVLVPLDHIEPGQKMPLVVHLGPAEKTEWVDLATLSPGKLSGAIGELVADLVHQQKWHQSLETQLCERAIELARQELRAFSKPDPQPKVASVAPSANGGDRTKAHVH